MEKNDVLEKFGISPLSSSYEGVFSLYDGGKKICSVPAGMLESLVNCILRSDIEYLTIKFSNK